MLDGLLNILANFLQLILNTLIKILNYFFALVETLLPASPFDNITEFVSDNEYLWVLNYFIPVSSIAEVLLIWAGAMAIFFVVSIVLRWVKVVK